MSANTVLLGLAAITIATVGGSCDPSASRIDCGFSGIDQKGCEVKVYSFILIGVPGGCEEVWGS